MIFAVLFFLGLGCSSDEQISIVTDLIIYPLNPNLPDAETSFQTFSATGDLFLVSATRSDLITEEFQVNKFRFSDLENTLDILPRNTTISPIFRSDTIQILVRAMATTDEGGCFVLIDSINRINANARYYNILKKLDGQGSVESILFDSTREESQRPTELPKKIIQNPAGNILVLSSLLSSNVPSFTLTEYDGQGILLNTGDPFLVRNVTTNFFDLDFDLDWDPENLIYRVLVKTPSPSEYDGLIVEFDNDLNFQSEEIIEISQDVERIKSVLYNDGERYSLATNNGNSIIQASNTGKEVVLPKREVNEIYVHEGKLYLIGAIIGEDSQSFFSGLIDLVEFEEVEDFVISSNTDFKGLEAFIEGNVAYVIGSRNGFGSNPGNQDWVILNQDLSQL